MKDEQKKNTSFICPNCASENIQSFPLVYKMGVNNINTTTSGVGVGIGLPLSAGIGIGGSTTNGVNKSLLAQQLAPPKKETYLLRAFFWLFTSMCG